MRHCKGKESEKEKVTFAIVNIAIYSPSTISDKLLQFKTSMKSLLKAEGNLEQVGRSKMPMKGIEALKRKF